MGIFVNNLRELKKYRFKLYSIVQERPDFNENVEVFSAKNGSKAVRVEYYENGQKKLATLHSTYNPEREGMSFAQEVLAEKAKIYWIYGFGFGYHIESICRGLPADSLLVVFEQRVDVFGKALSSRDLTDLIKNPNIRLIVNSDHRILAKELAKLISNNEDVRFTCHLPSVNILSNKIEDFKFFLLDLNLRKSISPEVLQSLEGNSVENRANIKQNVGLFFNKFRDMPIIIVCAGPSLDKNIMLLKDLENKALIMCVGKALKPLLNRGIMPHFIISIDPGEETYEQIRGLEGLDIPLILLATGCSIIGVKYLGPKFIACQYEEYLDPGQQEYLIKTGGSVSTTALDIAIRMGCSPIIFIGQDLAYTSNKHHCENSVHESLGVNYLKNMRMVMGWEGREIPTTLGMISFNKWVQNRVREEHDIIFINATEGGALINGFQHITFRETIKKYLHREHRHDKVIRDIISSTN